MSIIAGPNGAGKSTLAPFLLRDTFGLLEFVNADTISAGLSAFNAEAVAFEAGRVMLTRLRELAASKQNFAFESTLATRSYAPWISRLVEDGYDFHLLFLWLSTAELAIQRVSERGSRRRAFGEREQLFADATLEASENCSSSIIRLPMPGPSTIIPVLAPIMLIASGEQERTSTVVRPDAMAEMLVGNDQ